MRTTCTPGTCTWDSDIEEYVLVDAFGNAFFGATATECHKTSADADIARRDNATNRQAMAEYIAGLDATSADADIARRDNATNRQAMAEYIAGLWLADAETMQAEYRDEADTTAGLLAF